MKDRIPDEGEIKWAVKRLQNNRAGGASWMPAEDLKGWLTEAQRGGKKGETAEKEGAGGRTHKRGRRTGRG